MPAGVSDTASINAAAPAAPSGGYAWYTVLVLTVCYTLSFIDRQILSLLVGPIKADLKISDTQVGLLGGLAFSLFYTLLGLPIGRLTDRYNRRNIIAGGVVLWSIMTAACAFTRSFPGLFLARMGVGVGEAALSPSAVSMISDSFPKERLSSAMSFYSMGIYLGSGLALLVGGLVIAAITQTPTIDLPFVGPVASWRGTFLIVGLPGILVSLWVLTLREPPRGNAITGASGERATLTVRETVSELTQRWRSVGGIAVGITMQAIALYAFMLWSAVVLQRTYGWSPRDTGLTMGSLVLIGGCLGMFIGGRLSDHWLAAGRRDAAVRVGLVSSIAACIFFGLLFATLGSVSATVTFFALGATVLAMPTGSLYAASQMVLPNQVRGQAMAVILFIGNLGGLTLGPLLPGLLNDYVYKDEGAIGQSLSLTLTFATLAAALVYAWTRPHYRRDHERLHP